MYSVTKSIHLDMSHQVIGHNGPCQNIHGHTWEFVVTVSCDNLNSLGFVIDFKDLKNLVLQPVHKLLDHAHLMPLSIYLNGGETHLKNFAAVTSVDSDACENFDRGDYHGIQPVTPGGMKVALSPWNPTSEKLAKWLFEFTNKELERSMCFCSEAQVIETIHPVRSIATYRN